MKNFKLLFNTIAQKVAGPPSLRPEKPVKEKGGPEGHPEGDLTWGCYPHGGTCEMACPEMNSRLWMFLQTEDGCGQTPGGGDNDGLVKVPLQFTGTGSFEVNWHVEQAYPGGNDDSYNYEDGDLVPESGTIIVNPGSDNVISIDVRDDFGGPPCPINSGNCPESNEEMFRLFININNLPNGVEWDPQNLADNPGHNSWDNLLITIIDVDPFWASPPTIDLATYCEQNPGAPACQ